VKCEAYFSGVVKIIAFLELKQKLTFFKGLIPLQYGRKFFDSGFKGNK